METGSTSKRKRGSESQDHAGGPKKIKQQPVLDANNSNMYLEKALPFVLYWFKLGEILLCRQVSKTWRCIADTSLEKSLTEEPYDDDVYIKKLCKSPKEILPLPNFRSIQYAYIFKKEELLQKFNETMATHSLYGLSPFVGGAVVTLGCFLSSSSTLHPSTRELLELFGVHIKSLIIDQSGYTQLGDAFDVQIPLFMEAVKTCLQNTPNLKKTYT